MLFPSTLFVSQQPVILDSYLQDLGHSSLENNPDILIIEDYSIQKIRAINHFLSQKPYSHPTKIVYIPRADLLSIESQNTLLKNIEEPGLNCYFILTTSRPALILPTIISRCHQIRLTSTTAIGNDKALTFSDSLPQNLLLSESLASDKANILIYLEKQLAIYQQLLVTSPDQKTVLTIKKIIKAIQMLNANVDPKAAIDFLLLS